jgi:hypothetical protein
MAEVDQDIEKVLIKFTCVSVLVCYLSADMSAVLKELDDDFMEIEVF